MKQVVWFEKSFDANSINLIRVVVAFAVFAKNDFLAKFA